MPRHVLFSNHIAKTGGTSLSHAMRTSLGEEQFFPLGPFSRYQRFAGGLPQYEELDEADRSAIRVVHGHGVRPACLLWLPDVQPDFIVVIREPRAHARSRATHRLRSQEKRAEDSDSINFGSNPTTAYLVSNYNAFADYGKEKSLRNALSVLKRFRYVLLTEYIDRDYINIASDYNISASIGHKRRGNYKNSDKKSYEFRETDFEIDLELYERVLSASGAGIRNPAGFDPEALETSLARLRQASEDFRTEFMTQSYGRLATYAVQSLYYHVTLERLEREDHGPIADREAFVKVLRQYYDQHPYNDRQMARSKARLGKYLKEHGQRDAARVLRSESIALDPYMRFAALRGVLSRIRAGIRL
jgi:hypothetical protein